MKDKAMCLDKCINLDDTLYKPDTEKEYDCLVYSKKRRYDIKFEEFRDGLISLLESNNISFCEVRAGKFGKYEREDYFNLLNKSKIMVNLSLDECPGILNYESMFFNVPVVGSRKNVPINHSDLCYVEDVDVMTPQYLVRTESSELKYIEKIKQVLENYDNIVNEESPRDFITKHTSYENYCDNVAKIIEELYSE
jgi:glycosyltransferase involved in cell wall biosynthesis